MQNRAEFKIIFQRYYTDIYRFFYQRIIDKSMAHDLCQDVFINAWKNKIQFKEKVRPYIFTIAKNRLIDFYRSSKDFDNIDFDTILYEDSHAEDKTVVSDLLSILPERDRIILRLNRFDGFTQKEIADILGISIKTVEKRISLAMKKIINNKV